MSYHTSCYRVRVHAYEAPFRSSKTMRRGSAERNRGDTRILQISTAPAVPAILPCSSDASKGCPHRVLHDRIGNLAWISRRLGRDRIAPRKSHPHLPPLRLPQGCPARLCFREEDVIGRAIGAISAATVAGASDSTWCGLMDPCSQSMSVQSNPRCPTISAICGEGIITETPITGLPARSLSFRAFMPRILIVSSSSVIALS